MTENNSSPKQLVVISGKGGTGKTSITAAFAHLNADVRIRSVLVDADVDASNLQLLLSPKNTQTEVFTGGAKAILDQSVCEACGLCVQVCRFDAVQENQQLEVNSPIFSINPMNCEGCAACTIVCPQHAILMVPQQAGEWCHSETPFGPLYHANLFPGQENSGKLVTLIKQQARLHAIENTFQIILVDGPPGIGCPVISAFSGADLALLVTESTVAAIHDLDRILKTVRHFKLDAVICINKADLNPAGREEIYQYAAREGITVVGEIPYDRVFIDAVIGGEPVTKQSSTSPALSALRAIWQDIMSRVI